MAKASYCGHVRVQPTSGIMVPIKRNNPNSLGAEHASKKLTEKTTRGYALPVLVGPCVGAFWMTIAAALLNAMVALRSADRNHYETVAGCVM